MALVGIRFAGMARPDGSGDVDGFVAARSIADLSVDVTEAPIAWAARAVGLWRQQGVVVFPSLLSGAALHSLRTVVRRTLRNASAIDRSDSIRESGVSGSLRTLKGLGVSRYREALGLIASRLSLTLSHALLDSSQLLLGSSVLRTSAGAKHQDWHRDNSLRDERIVKVQISLSGSAADQGVLEVQPASHNRLDRGPQEGNERDQRAASVAMAVPAGSIVLYAPSLRHRGRAHTQGEDRVVVALTLLGARGQPPCGIPITASPEDVGRWWLVDGAVQESSR